MIQVDHVSGRGLYVKRWARRTIGGRIRRGYPWGNHWYPEPGDELYLSHRYGNYRVSVDYYVLRRSNGAYLCLECRYPDDKRAVLDVAVGNCVPSVVLADIYALRRGGDNGMTKVDYVSGIGLRRTRRAQLALRRKVRRGNQRVNYWYPEPGDELYLSYRCETDCESVEYYVLRQPNGEYLCLACKHAKDKRAKLDVVPSYMVPVTVLADIYALRRERGKR